MPHPPCFRPAAKPAIVFFVGSDLRTAGRCLARVLEDFPKGQGHATFEALCWLFCAMMESRK